ncbi:hypothetical protein PPERSA_01463 [Pseudocohnilembus persalinus]|uniref:Uncharacterized protein n=1 Tax=Pseudocohnilembus persalinus TaxID=266149 RepID=A0A0V0QHC8_PSEPJ|nr:hypothetical protein PPERSA_01463 [Pseudocohnilembus persalinus]|eukprot:KRX01560.1 hypothetical protein PPERSA_01463 [Pseudocohnilembus persalinus]
MLKINYFQYQKLLAGSKQLYEFYYYLSQEDYNQEKALGNQSTNLKRQLLSSFQEDISEIKTYLPRFSQINNSLTILVLVKDQYNALSNSTQSVQIELKSNLQENI